MKVLRLTLLTTLLLAGATTRPVSITNETDVSRTATQPTEPECYLLNGIWFCL